jgi:hypothetical protein
MRITVRKAIRIAYRVKSLMVIQVTTRKAIRIAVQVKSLGGNF